MDVYVMSLANADGRLGPGGPGHMIFRGFGMGPFVQVLGFAARGGQPPPQAAQVDPNGPDLFTAMREQLGLKLEGRKMALEVMVVDQIQPPTEE